MSQAGRRAPLFALFLVLFVVSVGFGIIIPILPLLSRDFGASAFMLGLMTASYAVVQFLFAPMWGQLSDRIGRKPILMVGATGMAISFLFMGLAQSYWTLFAARVMGGLLGSATMPAAQAMAAELSGSTNRAKAMGLMGAAFGTGFIFGPLIGGVLTPLGTAAPFFAGSAMGFLTIVLSAKVLTETRPALRQWSKGGASPIQLQDQVQQSGNVSGEQSSPGAGRATSPASTIANMRRALSGSGRPYYLLALAIMLGQSSLMTALAFSLTDRFGVGTETIGLVFAANGAVGALMQGVAIGRITDRLGELRTILIGLSLGVAAYVGIVAAPTLRLAVMAIVLTAVSMSLTRPSATSVLSKVTELPQGITMGVQSAFDSLGRVIGPLWAGFAYDLAGSLPFLSAAVVFTAMLLYLRAAGGSIPSGRPELVSE